MTTMTKSLRVLRIDELCSSTGRRVARHVPTNHGYNVVLELPGAGVELVDLEGRTKYVEWAAWIDRDLWRSAA